MFNPPQSPSDFADLTLQLNCKTQSFNFGRRLYRFDWQGQGYWLKTHLQHSPQPDLEFAYQNELNFYQAYVGQLNCLLPVQMQQIPILEQSCHTSLILPQAELLLACNPQQLNPSQIVDRIWQMLDAVESLHTLGYVHADLKQEHFVLWQQHVRLIDFEQVQHIDHIQQHLTATPRYMAPELFHHQQKSIQTDLYALGIILYEWLSQQRLSARSYQDWAYLHCQQLSVELPNISQGIQKWLKQLLAKHQQQRFKTIQHAKNGFTL